MLPLPEFVEVGILDEKGIAQTAEVGSMSL